MATRNQRSGKGLISTVSVVALAGLLALSIYALQGETALKGGGLGTNVAQAQAAPVDPQTMKHATALSRAFRNAAEVAMPSVVTIRSKTRAKVVRQTPQLKPGENPFKGTPFEDFFNEHGREGFALPNMPSPNMPPQQGMGSGVIIDKSGIVLTNNHVVQGADEVIIHLADGRDFKGYDIKTDEQTDLAVVRFHAPDDIPVARMGDSDKLEIGDWVIAIGNPFELEQTVSAGIISGKGRELGSVRRAKFLQTDAAINPGNSGGPLVSLEGEVIGINTAIASNTGSFNGVGFAIPVNLAKWVTNQLVKSGKVERAYLGVAIGEVTAQLAEQFGVERGTGVLVSEVFDGSPAKEAGLQAGDVVRKFAGSDVNNPRELQELVERTTLGSKNKIEVLRDGKPVTLDVVSRAMPNDYGIASLGTPKADEPSQPVVENTELGMQVTDMAADAAESLGFKDMQGALIAEVDPNGVAYAAGLRTGMLVLKVGKQEVKSAAEFDAAVKKQSLADGVLLLVRTKAGNRFVVLQQE
jgi:serine protease Do